MDVAGTSSDNSDFVHWYDLIDAYEDSDSDTSSSKGDDEMNSNPILDEIKMLLARMYRLVEECQYHVPHTNEVVCIPQCTSKLTGAIWIHWMLTNPNPNTCYERFRMWLDIFLKLCKTLKRNGYL
jgi:hypothetical protein